jgi:chemotaxis protein methyltransferase CheR
MNHEFAYSVEDFTRVRGLIAAYAGISLHEGKQNMVYNRLVRRVRSTGTGSFRAYLDRVEAPGSDERERFVNALTTNLTAFFREPHHFDTLTAKLDKTARPKVWSAACSTGEEAYSAAIALRAAGCTGAEIHATDIDTDALATAQRGVYPLEPLEKLGIARLRPHFLRGTGANAHLAMVRPEVRDMVKFSFHNLLGPEWPANERYDAVFCRNAMIYFDRPAQQRLLERFANVLKPGGLLLLGHSESCAAGHAKFRACGKTSYERK